MSAVAALLRARARRDIVQVPLWAVGTAALAFASYVGVTQSYGTTQDRTSLLAAALANPVILLFRGLPSGTGEGAFMVFLIFPWLALLAALMSTFLAVRHTRADEESGRAELVAATDAGRTAPVVATALHGALANLVLAVLTALAFVAVGLPVGGSLIAGAATGAVGLVFLGVGLVAAQLVATSRAANAASVWTVMITFVIAGIGNAIGTPSDDLTRMESSWLTWLSPFGWGENTRAFDADAWAPVALCVAVAVLLGATAVVLCRARDVGASFVAERRGPATAPRSLAGPVGLAVRLERGAIVGWAIGGLLTGMLSTSLASIVKDVGAENPAVEQVLRSIAGAGDIEQGTVVTFFTMLGILAASCAVQIVCRARQEEAHGTAEPVLAGAVGRVRYLAAYLAVAFAGVVVVIAAGVVGAAAGIAAQRGEWSLLSDAAVTGGGQVAAASVFLIATALAFVLAPRATIGVGWGLVLVGVTLGLFGPLFGIPEWLVHLSPVAVAPTMDGDAVDLRGLSWLVLATAVGAAASVTLMRRRELAPAD